MGRNDKKRCMAKKEKKETHTHTYTTKQGSHFQEEFQVVWIFSLPFSTHDTVDAFPEMYGIR